ncbi:cheW-like signal transduction phosphotransfer protein [Azospirillum sp. B510]|uniref:chemotaxis protein CheA n=1 Tax=Azospirillum sp. (strain B510) TaxID=137722 RepID=UPI0001C4BF53|nr:ATP-binding protein [Azospirillum sp. B510]BAI72301.1 cheW-like signal transduction phosphotransfer protein [Azospirillum sp. B510]
MSSELIETLWRQFGVEAGEHCDLLEKLLSATPGEGPEAERIAALFRSFHSLKGAARAMDLFAMEAVAHRAETILGRVRTGGLVLTEEVAAPLLEALDVLRGLAESGMRDRRDGQAPADLLERLDALGGEGPAAKPVRSPPPPPVRLHENERMLGLFVGLLHDGMATLTRALDLDSLDEEGAHSVDDTADRLQLACERLNFLPFADTLRRFREALAARDDEAILRELQGVATASARIGRLTGKDAGAAILATLLADHNAQILAQGSARADALLADPAALADAAAAGELAGLLDRMAATLDIVRLPRGSALLRVLADVMRRTPAADHADWPILLADARAALADLAEQAASEPAKDLEAEGAVALEERLRAFVDAVSAEREAGEARRPLTADELSALGLDPGLLRFLSPDSTADLRAAIADPEMRLYEVTAFLETSPEVASGFVQWMGSKVRAITNWPDFIDGKTWLRVLIASPQELASLADALADIDPGGGFLHIRACVPPMVAAGQSGEEPSADPTPPPAPSALPAVATSGAPVVAPAPPPPAPPSPPSPPAVTARPSVAPANGVLRVPGEAIDRFMARIDGMVLLSGDLNATANDLRLESALSSLTERLGTGDPDLRVLREAVERHRRDLLDLDTQLSRSVDRLREAALDLRVVPIETLFNQFPRVVRELARVQGKSVRFVTEGGDVRIDKSMVEMLYDPLMHMVRNAIDHGIEPPADREAAGKPTQATLCLRAIQRSSRVLVEIAEDGRGIPTEAVRAKAVRLGMIGEEESLHLPPEAVREFIFAPGFSTAETLTETSGRGVGMDVVRTAVTRLGGSIAIRTREGAGTAFAIDLPLSAAITRTLLVQVDDQVLAIPDRFVEEVCGFTADDFHKVSGCWTVMRRNRVLPVVRLADALGFPADGEWPPSGPGQGLVVVLRQGSRRIGVAIDRLLRRGDLFVRESHPGLAEVPGVGGVSLLNDGRIVIILEGDELYRLAAAAQRREADAPA